MSNLWYSCLIAHALTLGNWNEISLFITTLCPVKSMYTIRVNSYISKNGSSKYCTVVTNIGKYSLHWASTLPYILFFSFSHIADLIEISDFVFLSLHSLNVLWSNELCLSNIRGAARLSWNWSCWNMHDVVRLVLVGDSDLANSVSIPS
jgi:hypothetical protein